MITKNPMKILLTAFDPFGGEPVNPAQKAVEAVSDVVAGAEVVKCIVPTVFGKSIETVYEAMKREKPDVTFCIGQAGGRAAVTPERIGVNIRDARISDNGGNQPRGEFVAPDGPAAYFATVPVEKMAQAIRDAGIPATVSNSAGAFVCNDVLYSLLHHYAGTEIRVGFIHVPYLPEQGQPNMPLDTIVAALTAAISIL